MYSNNGIIDCHIHIVNGVNGIGVLDGLLTSQRNAFVNILSLTGMGDLTQNPLCMLYKAMHPDNCYAFGGLVHPLPESGCETRDYLKQIKRYTAMGFDGMKMIEGKPSVRKELGIPLDADVFDEYYSYLESERIPVLFHVADPESFWDIGKIPEWARSSGWFYGDGTYPDYQCFYREIDGILGKFPNLKIIFAHFYFMSENLKRAEEFLERWPNVCFDLTPGTEMYVNFSNEPDKWREFFIRYQDRILFGTDTYDPLNEEELENVKKSTELARTFLETDGGFKVWDLDIKGIGLAEPILEKIFYSNFLRIVGKKPRMVDIGLTIDECRQMVRLSVRRNAQRDIASCLEEVAARLVNLNSSSR